MKKLIIGFTVAICSHSVFAACPSQSKTVFNCTTTNKKVTSKMQGIKLRPEM